MIEILIGREVGQKRLKCTINGGRTLAVGSPNSVPMSVSRTHCKLVIDGDKYTVENLKTENVTYVDGSQIMKKAITANSKLQLGEDKYLVPLQQILRAVGVGGGQIDPNPVKPDPVKPEGTVYSLKPLEKVWNEYEDKRLEIQEKAAKQSQMARLQGILSMSAMCIGLIPGIPNEVRICIVVLALAVGIYFFYKGMSNDSVQRKIRDLEIEYRKMYKCPNPKCDRVFGNTPYVQIRNSATCPVCKCKYTS